MTAAEDINRVFSGTEDHDPDNEDEDYDEGHEDVLREPNIKSGYVRPLQTNKGKSRCGLVFRNRPFYEPIVSYGTLLS